MFRSHKGSSSRNTWLNEVLGSVFTRMPVATSPGQLRCSDLSAVRGSAGSAEAQVLFGSIVGNVTDASGAAVPDATVKVTQRESNESGEVKTNESGGFVLSTLPAGTYDITISKGGFRSYTAKNNPYKAT